MMPRGSIDYVQVVRIAASYCAAALFFVPYKPMPRPCPPVVFSAQC